MADALESATTPRSAYDDEGEDGGPELLEPGDDEDEDEEEEDLD
jgi:hypothetical protein